MNIHLFLKKIEREFYNSLIKRIFKKQIIQKMHNKITFILILFLCLKNTFAQNSTNWYSFVDSKTELVGFKDALGNVKIEPKFNMLTYTKNFKNIIAVIEKTEPNNVDNYDTKSYFLLKNGAKLGTDSLYMSDFTLDVEKEDKIRFKDPITNKVGFFNKKGKVQIPAIYSEALPFANGFALVLKDATKMCGNGFPFSKDNLCELPTWSGGESLIINAENDVIFNDVNFIDFQNINWFEYEINPKTTPKFHKTFTAVNGDIYAFLDLEAEFKNWFYTEYIDLTTLNDFKKLTLTQLIIAKDTDFKIENLNDPEFEQWAWVKENSTAFFNNNANLFHDLINDFKQNEQTDQITFYKTDPLFFDYSIEKKLYPENLENPNEQYPFFEVSFYESLFKPKFSMGFIKTKDGYKLQSISN